MNAEARRTLLLVEDEALIALAEEKKLEEFGYSVVTAHSGEEAVEAVERNGEIDLILMDIDLGEGMDGTQAAEQILSRHDLPLVFASSHTEADYVERTEGITSYGYIVKNSGDTVMRAALKMAFRLFEARRSEKAKEDELERYFNSSLDLVCIADMSGRFIRLNPQWERVTGLPTSELEGRMFIEFAHEDDIAATVAVLEELKQHKTVSGFQNRLRRADGAYRWIEWRARGDEEKIYATGRDITEQKRQSRALEVEKKRFEKLFRHVPTAIALVNANDRIVECNEEFTRLFGYHDQEVLGAPINEVIASDELSVDAQEVSNEVLGYGETTYRETVRLTKDGTPVEVAITGTPMDLEGMRYAYAIYQNISERKGAERALARSEARYRHLFEAAPVPIWVDDFSRTKQRVEELKRIHGDALGHYLRMHPQVVRDLAEAVRVLDANENALHLHGVDSKETFLSGITHTFGERSYEVFREELLRIAAGETRFTVEQQYANATGELVEVELHWSVAPGHEQTYSRVHVFAIDIGERKEYARRINSLLQQKDLLLKESHHRIKNHIAALSSLLAYNASLQTEDVAAQVLREAANRAQSMMLLYDKLYRAEQYERISVREYLSALISDSVSFTDPSGVVQTNVHIDDFLISAKRLAPLGIIVSELITNSIKHAFSDDTGGRISVTVLRSGESVRLEYTDNGVGFPDLLLSTEPADSGGFGRQLIDMLTDQIGGTLSFENGSGEDDFGAKCVIEFSEGGQ